MPSSLQISIVIGAMLSLGLQHGFGTGANPEPEKSLALRNIMKEMGHHLQIITDGISREDWELVAETASLIAGHPQPPLFEKMRILSFIGTEAGTFKSHDQKIHEAAKTLREAAEQKDGPAVIATFAQVQTSCLACHETFRKPFRKHFYGAVRR